MAASRPLTELTSVGSGNSSGSWFKRAVNAACSLVADAGSVGVGGDMGIGITGSGVGKEAYAAATGKCHP